MKAIVLISLFLILFQFSSEQPFTVNVTCEERALRNGICLAYSVDYCRSLNLQNEYYRCCYGTAEDSEGRTLRGCVPIYPYDWTKENIHGDDVLNRLTNLTNYSNFHIHCSSNYLSVSILLALLISLF